MGNDTNQQNRIYWCVPIWISTLAKTVEPHDNNVKPSHWDT